jgi:hypothetical protein
MLYDGRSRCLHRVGVLHFLLTKQMSDSGLPADVLVGKLMKDISFALSRGTIAQRGGLGSLVRLLLFFLFPSTKTL